METIETATIADMPDLLPMSLDLWPDYAAPEMEATMNLILQSTKFRVLLFRKEGNVSGFIYLAIRTDYVEGSDTSPTGYIEGIYVKPSCRKTGIARKLLLAGEAWLMEQNCTQVGSDIEINNLVSYNFHTRNGFKEANRLIAFIKDLKMIKE